MNIFDSLQASEQARQLANPDGEIGIEVAAWLNRNNRDGTARIIERMALQPGQQVLEIGFGNGYAAGEVLALHPTLRYAGIDISPTMVGEALRRNAGAVAERRASFHLGDAGRMPFPDAAFDAAFSIGVIHFWQHPSKSLAELRRVMRPGALTLHSCLDPRTEAPFVKPEYGFHRRPAQEWLALFRAAGFASADATVRETEQTNPDGTPTKRYSVAIAARA